MNEAEIETLAVRILAAMDDSRQIEPISGDREDFSLDEAYRISGRITARRMARGEEPVGWKIGFTNRTIWDEYGVHAPIWGPVYAGTLGEAGTPDMPAVCAIGHFMEPQIEPEIVFRLSGTPRAGMGEADLLGCIDAIGHGFEIVQSVYPGWKFRPADTVAAFAMHAKLMAGSLVPVDELPTSDWLKLLADFDVILHRDGEEIDRGVARNVLDGPLTALRHFVDGFDGAFFGRYLQAGDLVTTGTITRAFPVRAGEIWTTELTRLPLAGIGLRME